MRIITFNVNGVRAATRKGFWDWFAGQEADILCLQELKAHEHQLPREARPEGWHAFFHFAEKPGYSGVALYARRAPDAVFTGLGSVDGSGDWRDMDAEGRFLRADFGRLSIISLYVPSGSSSAARQAGKMAFLERFLPLMRALRDAGRELIVCGDINIAHQRIDLKNWRGNQRHSGFLPEERAWMSAWLNDGFTDVFRALYPDREQYSWWSNRGRARENNVGWRIDYHICTPVAARAARQVEVYTGQWFSDHAPVIADFGEELHGKG